MVSNFDNKGTQVVEEDDCRSPVSACAQAPSVASSNVLQLQNTWSLFYKNTHPKTKAADVDWQKDQQLIHVFNSVEEFWRLFNNIRAPRELQDSELSLCHSNTMLAWEHPRFHCGGRWVVRIPDGNIRDRDRDMTRLDAFWQYIVLGAIGEQLGGACGVSVSVRRNFSKVSVWMDSAVCSGIEGVKTVGRAIARLVSQLCNGPDDTVIMNFAPFATDSSLEKLMATVSQNGIEGDIMLESETGPSRFTRRN